MHEAEAYPGMSRRGEVHFFEGEGSPGDREYAFLLLKYEYYTLI